MPDAIRMGKPPAGFVPVTAGTNRLAAPAFRKAPGGAPATVAVGLARPGAKCALPTRAEAMAPVEANPIPSVREVAP